MSHLTKICTFWNLDGASLLSQTDSRIEGLTGWEARQRRAINAGYDGVKRPWLAEAQLLARQYRSPLIILLFVAALLSLSLGEYADSYVIIAILLLSGLTGYYHERKALHSVKKLESLLSRKSTVLRDKAPVRVDARDVVSGDIVLLQAGDLISADCRLLSSADLYVNEAALTGESFPVAKDAAASGPQRSISCAKNSVFKGTSVVTGTASALAVNVGTATEWDKIGASLQNVGPPSAFQRGIHAFGFSLMRVTVAIALLIQEGTLT